MTVESVDGVSVDVPPSDTATPSFEATLFSGFSFAADVTPKQVVRRGAVWLWMPWSGEQPLTQTDADGR